MNVIWYVFLSGALALATAAVFSRLVSRIPVGKGEFTDAQKSKLEEISAAGW